MLYKRNFCESSNWNFYNNTQAMTPFLSYCFNFYKYCCFKLFKFQFKISKMVQLQSKGMIIN